MAEVAMYSPGKPVEELQRELGLSHVIKMASNENPYGSSPKARDAMVEEMKNIHYYPEVTAPVLGDALSTYLNVTPDRFIFGNGSDEIIRMLTRTYVNPGEEVVMAEVTFPRYRTNVLIEGGVPVTVPMKQGTHDLEAMKAAINERTKMVFVCNPNNPTGTIVGEQELLDFLEALPPEVMIVLDEAYYEYVHSDDYLESLHVLDRFPNLVILRTFSKVYGMASVRAGYGITQPEVVQELLKGKEPFNVNRLAQAGAVAALGDHEFLEHTLEKNKEGRLYLEAAFQRMGLSFFPTHTNFIMVDVKKGAAAVHQSLLKQGIIIRPGHMMGYPSMLRVTIGTTEENEHFIQALENVRNEAHV